MENPTEVTIDSRCGPIGHEDDVARIIEDVFGEARAFEAIDADAGRWIVDFPQEAMETLNRDGRFGRQSVFGEHVIAER